MSDAPILGPVNVVTDLETAGDFEKKHTPYLSLDPVGDGTAVATIAVGHYAPHPNAADHFIQWIALYADDAEIARIDLSPMATWPNVTVKIAVDPGTVVRAVESCNLHGLWVAEVTA